MSVSVKVTMPSSNSENYVNYAAVHCGLPLIDKVEITGDYKGKAVLRITAAPAFVFEYKKEIILQNGSYIIQKPVVNLDDEFYREKLVEARDGELKIEVVDAEDHQKVLGFFNQPVHIQPYLHWDGWRHAGTMPAFHQPNHVGKVLKLAGEYAAQKGIKMYGYQGRTRESVKIQAECIYKALQDSGLHYISSPASFEDAGQKIRIPEMVLNEENKIGTCLDLAILYASCLEAASLNGGLVVIPGHAFAGVWLDENITLPEYIMTSAEIGQDVNKMLQDHFVPVECTTFTDNKNVPFEEKDPNKSDALKIGKRNMASLRYIIDVKKARDAGIVPVYTYTANPICDTPQVSKEADVDMKQAKEQLTKVERLQQQAMDISVRNKLLSGKREPFELQFPIDTQRFMKETPDEKKLFGDTKRAVINSGVTEERVEEKLKKLRKEDLDTRRERGKGNLYLTVNELKWKTSDKKSYKAVLYLCPGEIYRNQRGEYLFRVNAEEMFFNPVLKEMLKQDHNIDVSDIIDRPREDYQQQMERLRYLLGKKKGWEIVENVASLGLFDIPNEAIWKGLADEKVLKHEIVNCLLKGSMDWEDKETACEGKDKVYAYQADSSQSEIIGSAFQHKAQVIAGPAGNGKTQTITNIMLEGVLQGKRSLLVSEKFTALDVVRKMLEEVGLDKFTLSVVEGKHSASDVLGQISNTLLQLDTPDGYEWEPSEYLKRYEESGEKIKQYYELMTQKGSCGKSLEELYNMYEKYRGCPVSLKWPKNEVKVDVTEAENIIETLAETFRYYDQTQGNYLEYLKYDSGSPKEKEEAKQAVERVLCEGEKLRASTREMTQILNLAETVSDKRMITRGVEFAYHLEKCPSVGAGLEELLKEPEVLEEDEETREIKEEILVYIDELKSLKDSPSKLQKLGESRKKKALASAISELPVSKRKIMALKNIKDLDKLEEAIRHLNFNDDVQMSQDTEKREQYQKYIKDVTRGMSTYSEDEKECLMKAIFDVASGKAYEVQQKAKELLAVYSDYERAQNVAEKLVLQDLRGFEKKYPDKLKLILFQEWKKNMNKCPDHDTYQRAKRKAEQAGLSTLVNQIEQERQQGRLEIDGILDAFRKCWCEEQMKRIKEEFKELKDFNHIEYMLQVRRYGESEREIRKNVREEVLYAQMNRLPNIQKGAVNNPQLGQLYKLVKKGKKVSIRTIFEKAPDIMSELYPCMLMNPSAAAEYLTSDFPEFDLIIIDEGSQMPTYKSLIPISHGKRCMIFGDEQQLTPTTSFQRNLEEDGFMTPMESILDDAIVASFPRKTLRYHYRSENESLIAFSNKNHYGNKIITFPSCNTAVSGVSYELVEDGCYDRGESKTNEKEAIRIVEKVKEIYAELPEDTKETVGIITMNINQKNMIQSLLIKESLKNIDFGVKVDELISVMNLESCQGREWDFVILSPGYGPDKKGDFSVNMGPLGHAGGENRLNVMITRARKKMCVVTSLKPGMLKDAKSKGVREFKDFLLYAHGDIQYDTRETEQNKQKTKNNSMIDSIASALRAEGFTVHTNIGSSECKVDIGIVSKKDGNCYALGILTDHFKSTGKAIRDREIVYPEALQRKGWKIYRLHSLSWYANPENEIEKIKKIVCEAEGSES